MDANSILQEIIADAETLLCRALVGKIVNAFGADGGGQYGSAIFAHHYMITDIDIGVNYDSSIILARIMLGGYDSGEFGHIATDKNLEISLNKLLLDEHIDPSCWSWGDEVIQGHDYFSLVLDVQKLDL